LDPKELGSKSRGRAMKVPRCGLSSRDLCYSTSNLDELRSDVPRAEIKPWNFLGPVPKTGGSCCRAPGFGALSAFWVPFCASVDRSSRQVSRQDPSTETQNDTEDTDQEGPEIRIQHKLAPNLGPGFPNTPDDNASSQTSFTSPGLEVRRLVFSSPGIRGPQCLLGTLLCFCG
jgi:hypothetical protein